LRSRWRPHHDYVRQSSGYSIHLRRPPQPTLFPYTTLFRSGPETIHRPADRQPRQPVRQIVRGQVQRPTEVAVAQHHGRELPRRSVGLQGGEDRRRSSRLGNVPGEERQWRVDHHVRLLAQRSHVLEQLLQPRLDQFGQLANEPKRGPLGAHELTSLLGLDLLTGVPWKPDEL